MSISLRKTVWPQALQAVPAGRSSSGGLTHEEINDLLVDGWVAQRRGTFAAEEDRDGDAPDALAGDAPVGAGGDHVGDAFLAPDRVPGDGLDLG
jgi:hypothetical protein